MASTTITPVNAQAVGKKGSEEASRSGIWVGIFAITMSFAAFTSALFVREGAASDWQHIALPPVLYLNTVVLLLSSVTFELSRRTIPAGPVVESDVARKGLGWLFVTLVLGMAFFAGQYVAWQQLWAHGIFLATNPNSSFFYVLTAMHGVHLLGGIAALIYVIGRLTAGRSTFRHSTFDNTAIYWHFMGILWVYLLLICRMKL
jgi:cytochrome c oxidase subunit III